MPPEEQHLLECRSLSLIDTVHTGSWFSRLYSAPVVAQFLRDVSFELRAGEMLAVAGTAGSGKSRLLACVSSRARGVVGGSVLLDRQQLTEARFQRLCAVVDLRLRLLPFLTVREALGFQLRLTLGARLTAAQLEDRLLNLLHDWELLGYGHEPVASVSESSRRRVLMALACAKDPALIIADDAVRNLEPLSAYQLLLCLQSYIRRHRRLAIVSMRTPRSDVSQLFDRILVLFYGEPVFSGLSSQLPVYLFQHGLSCPKTENPAAFLVSLASIDRETTARYEETQEAALELVAAFKNQSGGLLTESRAKSDAFALISSTLLCSSGRPSTAQTFGTLLARSVGTLCRLRCFAMLGALPLVTALLALLGASIERASFSLPHSVSAQLSLQLLLTLLVTSVTTAFLYRPLRQQAAAESSEKLHSDFSAVLAFLLTSTCPQLLSLLLSTCIFCWALGLNELTLALHCLLNFASCFFCGQALALASMLFLRSTFANTVLLLAVATVTWTFTAGTLRTHATLAELPEWTKYLAFPSVFRFANRVQLLLVLPSVSTNNCRRNERQIIDRTPAQQFCRWTNSSAYIDEMYPQGFSPPDLQANLIIVSAFAFTSLLILILYACKLRPKLESLKYG